MIKITISIQDDILIDLLGRLAAIGSLGEKGMPTTSFALKESAKIIQKTWQNYLIGKQTLPNVVPMGKPDGRLVGTIKEEQTGSFQYEIFSESKKMEYLIKGTPRIDMKKTHTRGPRSRVSMKGVPYVIVPFRWGTPPKKGEQRVGFGKNVMPVDVYEIVSNHSTFRPTITTVEAATSDFKTLNARGELVGRAQYSDVLGEKPWGDRLTMKGSDMNGMSNMLGNDGKTAGYFTFRVISRDKPGNWDKKPHKKSWEASWVKEAVPGRPIIQGIIKATQEDVKNIIEAAVRSDLGL